MSRDAIDEAEDLVAQARVLYRDEPTALETLDDLHRRLTEPLRLAVAGIVKAGKSTLLNAMIGEQIAPTDAGECTRVVTWYRYAVTPSVTLYPISGGAKRLAVKREHGKLVLDLNEYAASDVERIEVGWPASALRSVTLIDTPGIASLSQQLSERSAAFLAPEDAPSSADAIVYLMRHLHSSDVRFLEAFRDTAAGPSRTVNAVAVLSRTDEIGSGRIDSLISARKVARRYELDGDLSSLALGVIPVAGLLAEGARTLRESEFAAFRALAGMPKVERDRLLVSADRFVRPTDAVPISAAERKHLLARFGIFGVRLATSLTRAGVTDSTDLALRMVQQSGLDDLAQFVQIRFGPRANALKVRGVLDGLATLLRRTPRAGAAAIEAGIERLQLSAHALRELSILSQARVSGLPLAAADAALAVRITGGLGTDARQRLALAENASPSEVEARISEELDRWRTLSHSPLTERDGVAVCRVVIRSLEQVASELAAGGLAGDGATADIVLSGGPRDGAGEDGEDEREEDEGALGGEELTEQETLLSTGDHLDR